MPPPIGADIQYLVPRFQKQLSGDEALFRLLGLVQAGAGGGEIIAGISLIGVKEQIVKVPGQVVMTGGVEARPAGRVPLLQPAQQPIDPPGGPL